MSIGCRLRYSLPQPTPLIAMLNVHYSRFGDFGRDAADVPLTQTFGQNTLTEFKVWADKLS